MKRDHRGMSLVEIIIVIAVMGILAGVSTTMIGQVRYANARKTVEAISTALDSQRVTTMSKTGTTYLYIYRLSDGYYMKKLDHCISTFSSVLDDKGTKLAGGGTDIFMNSASGTRVEDDTFIRIAYTKGGLFDVAQVGGGDTSERTNVDKIVIRGSSTYTITLVKTTGKHIVE